MALALTQVLPRFGSVDGSARSPAEAARTLDDLVADAERRGRAEAAAAGEREIAAIRAEAEAAAERRLADARHQWVESESRRLADALGAGITEMEERIARAASRTLAPFVAGAARERALADLARVLVELRGANAAKALRIAGPADLIAAFRRLPAAETIAAEYVIGGGVEVTATLDETVVETQLGAWAARMSEAADG